MAELDFEKLSIDPATQEMLKKAKAEGVETIWDRAKTMKPCPIGAEGACCRICAQGPCRVPPPKKAKEGETAKRRSSAWACAAPPPRPSWPGTSPAWSAAGPRPTTTIPGALALLFKEVAHGKAQGYQIKDVAKLKRVAKDWDVAITEGEGDDAKPRAKEAIAQELADKVLLEFGQQDGEITYVNRAPKKRQEIWRKLRRRAPGLRHRDRRTDAPHPHGRGPGIPQHHQAVHPHRPVRRLGRLHDLHRPAGHPVRHARCRWPARSTWASSKKTTSTSSSTAMSRCCPR